MDIEEAMRRLKAAGWGGLCLYDVGNAHFMGYLIKPNAEPDPKTSLWQYAPTAEEALTKLVETAESNLYN